MARQCRYRIGDVFMMRFGGVGAEQGGYRPGIVFQNNTGNIYSPNIIAIPLTTSIKKTSQPTHVVIPSSVCGLREDSMALCENPERMSKDRVGRYITSIPSDYMSKVAQANLLATSAISLIEPDTLLRIWQKAAALNATV